MKLYKALKKGKRKPGPPPAPPVETDHEVKFACHCMVCGDPTGKTKDIRSTLIDPKDFMAAGIDPQNPKIREGMCSRCSTALAKGHTILINQSGTKGAILEIAANEKLAEEARGKLISIPDEAMEEMLSGAKPGAVEAAEV